MRRKKLFISYSHKDVCWLGRMREHLAVLELEGLLDLFEDTQIGAGEDWYARLDQEMREARIALLLISASFLTSAFIRTHIGSVEYDQFMVCRIYNADHSDYERIVLLVRSPRHRTERIQDQIPLAGLAMKRKATKASHFAVCINNEGYKASLEVGKLYRVIPDVEATSHGYLRVIDESGEDYGYAADRFFPLEVPQALAEALQMAG